MALGAAFEHRDEMELQNSDSPVRGVMHFCNELMHPGRQNKVCA